jgi:CRP/FNR family transcriptional regulator, cyclic AMP receptor protein
MSSSIFPRFVGNSCAGPLQECPLFRELSSDSLQALDNIIQPTSFEKDATLFAQGRLSYGVFILISGRIKLTSVTVGGSVDLLAIAKRGEAVGLSSAVSGRPHVATATTTEMTQTVIIQRDSFLEFIRKHGDAAVRVAQVLAELYDVAQEEKKGFLVRESAVQKLARLLLNLSTQLPENGNHLRIGLTHEEIGNMIGTSRETVSRTLGDLKNRNILVLRDSKLIIHDRSALRHIADA